MPACFPAHLSACRPVILSSRLLASTLSSFSHAHLPVFIPALSCFASHQLVSAPLPSPVDILTSIHLPSHPINKPFLIHTTSLCPAFGFPQLIVTPSLLILSQHQEISTKMAILHVLQKISFATLNDLLKCNICMHVHTHTHTHTQANHKLNNLLHPVPSSSLPSAVQSLISFVLP